MYVFKIYGSECSNKSIIKFNSLFVSTKIIKNMLILVSNRRKREREKERKRKEKKIEREKERKGEREKDRKRKREKN